MLQLIQPDTFGRLPFDHIKGLNKISILKKNFLRSAWSLWWRRIQIYYRMADSRAIWYGEKFLQIHFCPTSAWKNFEKGDIFIQKIIILSSQRSLVFLSRYKKLHSLQSAYRDKVQFAYLRNLPFPGDTHHVKEGHVEQFLDIDKAKFRNLSFYSKLSLTGLFKIFWTLKKRGFTLLSNIW